MLLTPCRKSDEILGAINLLQDARERRRIVSAGRRHVKRFSLSEQVSHLVSILERVA